MIGPWLPCQNRSAATSGRSAKTALKCARLEIRRWRMESSTGSMHNAHRIEMRGIRCVKIGVSRMQSDILRRQLGPTLASNLRLLGHPGSNSHALERMYLHLKAQKGGS